MKAITIHQPWASLIACGAKHIETRGWFTHYRGPIAIHASKFIDGDMCIELRDIGRKYGIDLDDDLPRGAVVAIAELVDCVEVSIFGDDDSARLINGDIVSGDEFSLGDYTPARYAWLLDNVKAIDPVPARGRQGLWNWERDDE